MSTTLQHLLVLALALGCLIGLVVRRVRAFRGQGPACDGCAKGCEAPPPGERLVPPSRLVRR